MHTKHQATSGGMAQALMQVSPGLEKSSSIVLIVGPPGSIEYALANHLASRGFAVRILAPDTNSAVAGINPEITLAQGATDDPDTATAAMQGVSRLVLSGSPLTSDIELQQLLLNAVGGTESLQSITKLSIVGADDGEASFTARQHGMIEERVNRLSLPHATLRFNFLMKDVLGFAPAIAAHDEFLAPMGRRELSFVDMRDVEEVAYRAVVGTIPTGRSLEVTGPEALSFEDLARLLSDILGRPIRYTPSTSEEAIAHLTDSGVFPDIAEGLLALLEVYATPAAARTSSAIEEIIGSEPRTFEAYIRENASNFCP